MQAIEIVLPAAGEPETLQVRTREVPAPGPGQALVRMEATGVSFAEQQMRRGKYYDQPAFPFVPGYDLVGIVEELGPDAVGVHVGQRVAALTKIGGWASHVVLDAADLTPVPDGVTAQAAETLIVNGVTAWRMLHDTAEVRRGQTIVVLGAAGGVGSILVQLALHAGIRVIGTAGAGQQARLRALGVEAVDYRAEDVPARVRELAPDGVDAVFDHVGGPGLADSWRMLARGGTLVSYGSAATRDVPGSAQLPMLTLIGRLAVWNALPNGRSASFFSLWAGVRKRDQFRRALRADLVRLFALLADGVLAGPVDSEFPLSKAADAMRRAEGGNLAGKVVLVADER